ncbi:MAG: O-antigen ligase family protein [Candidatus Omnitrophica bacterium]|nr:O-antigen ligase family protein [Candidatus Omnitrophota bacterium]
MKNKIISGLDFMIYWMIILLPFFTGIAPAFPHAFIGVMTFCFVTKKIIKRDKFFDYTPINLPFFLLLAAAVISFRNTINLFDSIHGIEKLVLHGFTFLVCSQEIRDKKHISRIIISVALATVLIGTDTIWQLFTGKDFIQGEGLKYAIDMSRSTASFPNSNILGIYLTALTPLVMGLALFYYKGRMKFFMLSGAILGATGVLLSFSRGAGLGLYLAILLMSIVRKNKLLVFSAVGLLAVFVILMPKNIKNWAKEINYNPVVFMVNYDRISIYRNAINMTAHHPFIGVGVNTFCRNYATYKLPEPENAKSAQAVYAHNNFLQMAGEIGLIGLSMFLWLLFRLFKNAVKLYKKLDDQYFKITLLSLIACLTAFLVNGMTETSMYYSRISMIFWYLVGFSLAFNKFDHIEK